MPKKPSVFQEILFRPSVRRVLFDGSPKVANVTLGGNELDEAHAVVSPSGTFRYDSPGSALKSTQQLNVDFSKFKNHTFFNSAEMKVQVAFDKIINSCPFDGTLAEYEVFMDGLSGFEKYVYDQFPKHRGYLQFNSASSYENYLDVVSLKGIGEVGSDSAGTANYVLPMNHSPFTVEMQLFVPPQENDNCIIIQKASDANAGAFRKGFALALSASTSRSAVNLVSILASGSTRFVTASAPLQKGKFQHVAVVYDRDRTHRLMMYVDGVLVSSSSIGKMSSLGIEDANIMIASGASMVGGSSGTAFVPKTQLSGAIDELRIFEAVRSRGQLNKFAKRSLFPPADGSLKLYFKFNEPSGSFAASSNRNLVLDYSGNGLHSHIKMGDGSSFNMNLRSISSLPVPILAESPDQNPVLFPSFESVTSLCSTLLTSASQYDFNNPNLITKLIPTHYLTGEGLASDNGDLDLNYGYTQDQPGGGRMQSAQIISSLLYLWGESFDEVKMFVAEFGRAVSVNYESEGSISDQLLPFLARYYGFNLPNQFSNASLRQYFEGEDLTVGASSANLSLQNIQNTMWRRILVDLPELFRSRGTRNSLEAIFRDMGIRPGGAFRIKEYGGSKTRKIGDTYEKRSVVASMLDFSGSLNRKYPGGTTGSGKDVNRPLIQSGFLSGSRVEPGEPEIRGAFVNGKSNNVNDGLFTSGSWAVEGVFKLEPRITHHVTQSLLRLQTTGSRFSGASNNWLLFNVVAFASDTSTSTTGSITLFGRPAGGSTAKTLKLSLSGTDIFDGRKWYLSFGRCRNDQTGSYTSSSYYLRAGQMGQESIQEYREVTNYFNDSGDNLLNTVSGSTNASGSMVVIGSQSLKYDASLSAGGFLNTVADDAARFVSFSGKASNVRFFSKNLSRKEALQHIRSFKSLGVTDPSKNFNFNKSASGSFERLRLNLSCNQPITESNSAGDIRVFDFSQNKLHASGTGWVYPGPPGVSSNTGLQQAIKEELFNYLILSPQFEIGSEPNKVRIRSFQRLENIRKSPDGVSFAPLYTLPAAHQAKDDRRVAIEVSAVQALNEDIINIFATLDYLDNAIGAPELVFSQQYRELSHLRRIYFNRLEEKMSIQKFFDFFKWFDSIIGDLLEEMMPSSTRYLGTNFVVESHMLERPKFTYKYSDMYVGIIDRREASVILLQQFLGAIRKV